MNWVKGIVGAGAMAIASLGVYAQTPEKEKTISDLYNAIKSETDIERKETLLVEMEKKGDERSGPFSITDVSRQMVALAYAEKKNTTKAVYWTHRMTDAAAKDRTMLNVIDELADAGAIADAESLVKSLYKKYKDMKEAPANADRFNPPLTPAEVETMYGMVLYKKGGYKKALEYLAPVEDAATKRGDLRRAEYYAMALAKTGQTNKAVVVMEKTFLAPGHRSPAFKAEAEKAFATLYGNGDRYKQLTDSLALADKKHMEEKLAKLAVNEPAPDFTLIDLQGKTISLSSLRGKTVVLDFWATWCQPCVASFPGMQKAVDHYKNDPSVVFMFIHTAERSADPVGDVKRFMDNKKYRFDVYMDLKDKETKKNNAAEQFKVRAIPAKFVIDKDGNIRYKNTGYVSEEEGVLEISTMVENSRKVGGAAQGQAQAGGDKISQALKELHSIRDEAQQQARVKELVNSNKEQDLLVAYGYYYSIKESEKAEEVMEKGIQQFPKGELAYTGLTMKMNNEREAAKKEALLETITREYPTKPSPTMVFFDLAQEYAATGNKEKMWYYTNKLKAEGGNNFYINTLLRVAPYDAAKGEALLKPVVDSLEARNAVLKAAADTSAKKVRDQRSTGSLVNTGVSAYTKALIGNGKGEEAYQYITRYYKDEPRNPFKPAYLNALLATKRYKEAFPLIEDAVKNNAASPEVKAKFKDAYTAVKGSPKGFEEYNKNLLLSIKEKIKEEALKQVRNEPAPLFTLQDVDGKEVSLADLKGKVVVMDFWATWCGPCKASFPSMKLAQEKYKGDPNVKFVFIHTWENAGGDPVKAAKDYVVNNNYPFHVLMDLRDPATKESKVATLYHVKGIPNKVIIDPKGNIRFSVSGFNSVADVALVELSAMIDYAKTH